MRSAAPHKLDCTSHTLEVMHTSLIVVAAVSLPMWGVEGLSMLCLHNAPTCLSNLISCLHQVPRTVLQRVSSDQDKDKLGQYELRSYVEDSKRMAWCPAPGCEHAVECMKDLGENEPLDVTCKCGAAFCFSCQEEAHRPVCCMPSLPLIVMMMIQN